MMKASLAALLLVGCGSSEPPVITALSLEPTAVTPGGEATLTVTLENFSLRDPDAQTARGLRALDEGHGAGEEAEYPDGGHFHVYVDTVETNPLQLNCPDYCEHPGFANTVRVKFPDDALSGAHELIVRLNADDHTFLNPPIQRHVDFMITSEN